MGIIGGDIGNAIDQAGGQIQDAAAGAQQVAEQVGGQVQDAATGAQQAAGQVAGTVLGTTVQPTQQVAEQTQAVAGTDRTSVYNQEIERVKSTQPDYTELEKLWRSVTFAKTLPFVKKNYPDMGLTEEQFVAMANRGVENFKKRLSQEEYTKTLDELHEQVKATAIKQLEFERDHPDQSGQRAPVDETDQEAETLLASLFYKWVGERVAANIEGAQTESGIGA